MKPITQDEIDRLKAPFPLEAHSIREGNKTKSGKIQWFVYMEKTEVESRLNEVFGGEWGSTQPVLTVIGNNVAATIGITIRGITRGNTGEDSNGQEKAKGATTDAFRRAAADWGVAKYLWEMEEIIYTDGYDAGNWDQQKQRKNDAFAKFKSWYQKKFGNGSNSRQDRANFNAGAKPAETTHSPIEFTAISAKAGKDSEGNYLELIAADGTNAFTREKDVLKNAGYEGLIKEFDIQYSLSPAARVIATPAKGGAIATQVQRAS